jgi:hypothetical protein
MNKKNQTDHIVDTNKMVTAVEWLIKKMNVLDNDSTIPISITATKDVWSDLFQQAKAMEKEQIMKAVYDAMGTNFDPNMGRAEQYYNETYGK